MNIPKNPTKIELPGFFTLEWLPECKESPKAKRYVAKILYSGEFEHYMRHIGMSEKCIALYRTSLAILEAQGQQSVKLAA